MAYNLYLKINGIDGESTAVGHENEIELLSFSWGVTNQPNRAGAAGALASKPQLSDFALTKMSDKSSAKLFEACATGKHFPSATLTCRKADGQDYLQITFQEVLVSDYVAGGHANSDTEDGPLDQVSLNFQKISYQHLASVAPTGVLVGAPTQSPSAP